MCEQRQYLYFCTSKAGKVSTCGLGRRIAAREEEAGVYISGRIQALYIYRVYRGEYRGAYRLSIAAREEEAGVCISGRIRAFYIYRVYRDAYRGAYRLSIAAREEEAEV